MDERGRLWGEVIRELQRQGRCNPNTVEAEAKDHFGEIPEVIQIILRMWRKAGERWQSYHQERYEKEWDSLMGEE